MFNVEFPSKAAEPLQPTEAVEEELVFQDTPAALQGEDFFPNDLVNQGKSEPQVSDPEEAPPVIENVPDTALSFEHTPTFDNPPSNFENTPSFEGLEEPNLLTTEVENEEVEEEPPKVEENNAFENVPKMEIVEEEEEEDDGEEEEDEVLNTFEQTNEKNEQKEDAEKETEEDVEMKDSADVESVDEFEADPYAPKVVEEEFETCGVCLDPNAYEENQIIYCDGCDMAVHQHCYGVFKIPDGDWFCRACEAHIKHITPRNSEKLIHPPKDEYWGLTKECVLCEAQPKRIKWALTEVAGKRSDKKFCHVLCAQYISETWFEEKDTSTRVENVQNVHHERRKGICTFCGKSDGAKLLCSIKSCQEYFHAPCALANGCVLKDVAAPTDTYSNRVVYCINHRPIIIERNGNNLLKYQLKQSQIIEEAANRNSLGWNWSQTPSHVTNKRKRQEALKKKELKRKQRMLEIQKRQAKEKQLQKSAARTSSISQQKKRTKKWTMKLHSDSETESEDTPVLPRPDGNVTSTTVENLKIKNHRNSLSMKAARKFAPNTRPSTIDMRQKKLKRKREHDEADLEHQKRKKINKKPATIVTTIPKTGSRDSRRIDKSKTSKHGKARVYSDLPRKKSFEYRRKRRDDLEDSRRRDVYSSRDHASDPRRRPDRYDKYDRDKRSKRYDRYEKDSDMKRNMLPDNSPSPQKLPPPTAQRQGRRLPPPPPPTFQTEVVVQGRPHPLSYGGSIVPQPSNQVSSAPAKFQSPRKKVVWSGKMGKSTASDAFDLYFKFVAGHEVNQLPLPKDFSLPSKGRIRFENLTNFLPLMQKSSRKHLSLVEVHPQRGASTPKYNDFCQYYRDAERGAVVDLEKSHGITIYIMPVGDNWSRDNLLKIKSCFGVPPPLGVMWAIIIQFPEIQKIVSERLPPPQRIQPNARQIKTIRIDPRQHAADPRASADPRMASDPRMAAEDAMSDLMNPDISDALKRLEQMD